MILIHIICSDKNTSEKVLNLLLSNKLLYSGFICENCCLKSITDTDLIQGTYTLTGISKALLFREIEKELQKNTDFSGLMIFSSPVLNLSSNHHENMLNLLQRV